MMDGWMGWMGVDAPILVVHTHCVFRSSRTSWKDQGRAHHPFSINILCGFAQPLAWSGTRFWEIPGRRARCWFLHHDIMSRTRMDNIMIHGRGTLPDLIQISGFLWFSVPTAKDVFLLIGPEPVLDSPYRGPAVIPPDYWHFRRALWNVGLVRYHPRGFPTRSTRNLGNRTADVFAAHGKGAHRCPFRMQFPERIR